MASTPALLVLTTCATAAEAHTLAAALVNERLAACVTEVPRVASTYRWRDAVEHGEESLLIIKTTETRFAALEHAIRTRSSYEVPEVLAIRAEHGSLPYLAWLRGAVEEPAETL